MEKFQIDDDKNKLELFANFVSDTKEALADFIDNIKDNIKKYDKAIEDTIKDIETNESSREKCEREIVKMEKKIDSIKENIENVENTYKKIVDAYSSTSKGETKELYSEIIDGAKSNCERDVEKNKFEIDRLNSDIEAIKNNIAEFTNIIDDLNKTLEEYKLELCKYNKALEYFEDAKPKIEEAIEEIHTSKLDAPKKKTTKKSSKKEEPVEEEPKEVVGEEIDLEVEDEPIEIEEEVCDLDEPTNEELVIEPEIVVEEPVMEPIIEPEPVVKKPTKIQREVNVEPASFEDSLKQIYDLTGYKPKKEDAPIIEEHTNVLEEVIEPEPKRVSSNNLEDFFKTSTPDIEPEPIASNPFETDSLSAWERMLNGEEEPVQDEKPLEDVGPKRTLMDSANETVNQLLKPYGTTIEHLSSLVASEITYKNGTSIPFELDSQDLIKAINDVDGIDLKEMKKVGPEITLLRKVKAMKEGRK